MDLSECSQPDSQSVEKIGELQRRLTLAVIQLGQHDVSSKYYSDGESDARQCLNELGALPMTVGDLRVTKIGRLLNDYQLRKILPADLSVKAESLVSLWKAKTLEYRDIVKQKLSKSPHTKEGRRTSAMLREPEVVDVNGPSDYSKLSSLPSLQPPGMMAIPSSSTILTSHCSPHIKGVARGFSEKNVISTTTIPERRFPRDKINSSADIVQPLAQASKSSGTESVSNSPQQKWGLGSIIKGFSYKVAGEQQSSPLPPTRPSPKDHSDNASFKAPAPLRFPLDVTSVRPPEALGMPPAPTSLARSCIKTANGCHMEYALGNRTVDSVSSLALDGPGTQVIGSTVGRDLSQAVSTQSAPVEIPLSQAASVAADRVVLKALVTQNCNTFSRSLSVLMSKVSDVEETCKSIKGEISAVLQQVREFQSDFDKYCPCVIDASAHARTETSERCQFECPAPLISAESVLADLERSSAIGEEASAYEISALSARCDASSAATSRAEAGASSMLRADCVSLGVADLPSSSVGSAFLPSTELPEHVSYPMVDASTANHTLQPAAPGDIGFDPDDLEDDDVMSCTQVIDDLYEQGCFADKVRPNAKSNFGKFRDHWNRKCKKKDGIRTAKLIQSSGCGRWKAAHRPSLGKAVALEMLTTKCRDPYKELERFKQ